MKKALLGTTALIAGGLIAGSVMAADLEPAPLPAPVDEGWEVTVGGFANAGFYYFSNNLAAVAPGFEDQTFVPFDSEIHFTASTTLANGIRIAVRIELEGAGNVAGGGNSMDEAFMAIEGNFGRFEIGANDSAFNGLDIGAPGYGYLGVDGSTYTARLGSNAATGDFDDLSGDANKVTYYTPRISGFQAGASFTPNDSNRNGARTIFRAAGSRQNIIAAAANYNNTFNDISLAFSAGIETGKFTGTVVNNGRLTDWAVGARVGMAGFTVGGNYSRRKSTNTLAAAAFKNRIWIVAASYGTGPWTVGAGYLNSKRTGAAPGTFKRYGGGATYAVGTGVTLTADVNRETRSNVGVNAKGWIAGVGISTSF